MHDTHHTCRHLSRRRLLAGVAAASVPLLAGCLGGDESDGETPDAIALDGPKQCDVCGMVIEDTHGPNGQTFFEGEYPSDRDGPAWYDSVRELWTDRFTQETRHEPQVTYVTDYSAVEYTIEEGDDRTFISSAVDVDSFVPAAEAVFVIESRVEGVMGPDLLPFSAQSDAEAFVDTHSGRVLAAEEITPEVVESL